MNCRTVLRLLLWAALGCILPLGISLPVPAQDPPPAAPAPGSPKALIQALQDKLYAEDKQKAAAGDYNRNTSILTQIAQFGAQVDSGRYLNLLGSWENITRSLDSKYYADAKAIQDALLKAQSESEKKALKEIEETVGQMKDPILAAKTDSDLDDLWLKLTRQQRDMASRGFNSQGGYNNGDAGPTARLNGAIGFVTSWQLYLANKNAGFNDAARTALQRVASPSFGTSPYPIVPRADIEKRLAELGGKKSGSDDSHSEVDTLIDGMTSGADASAVLLQVEAMPHNGQDEFSREIRLLATELESLVACTVDAQEGRYGNILATCTVTPQYKSPWYPKLSKFFTQNFTNVIPSFVDWKDMPPRKDGEKPDDYILRCVLAAKEQRKWWTELNLLEVWRNYAMRNGTPTWLLGDLYSLQNMMNGENLEAANQYQPAIVCYLGAVRFGSKYGPVKEATEKLKTLQQSQPDAYAAAVKDANNYFVVPPADIGKVPDKVPAGQ